MKGEKKKFGTHKTWPKNTSDEFLYIVFSIENIDNYLNPGLPDQKCL